ncbi:MAG: hypothetical protein IPP18_11435 [Rhodocyclaceae bacterium]|nr:hypothetical protein [Rhodocyclaceae bacterium]
MTLSALIRKRDTGNLATAIPAISATQPKGEAATVARIATVAVANPKEEKTAPPAKVGAGDTATASRWWLIHYPDRDPVEVACCPEATHADILERHPDAVAAEPFTPTIRQPSAPLTASEETAIRAWLALIEETDPATIAEVIGQCQRDAEARDYFTGRAAADNLQKNGADAAFDDDRRTCDQCANLIARRCQAAKRGEIVASRNYEPIRDLPRRCEGYAPGATIPTGDRAANAGRD